MNRQPFKNIGAQEGSLVGPYRLVRKLGAGGFASVWQGEDPAGQTVAVKVLHSKYCTDKRKKGPSIAERFLDEARLLQEINIPGVVKVLEFIDERERGVIAYTMELLFGSDLSQIFLKLPGTTILEIFAVVCETLGRLHERGIIHRDIKSANVFVSLPDSDNNRTIKLIDFGVAKALQAKSMMDSTATGVIVGTIQTLAPESIKRLNGEDVELSWSIDQWGVGVALFHCLSGRLPFNGTGVLPLITDIQTKEPPPLVLRPSINLNDAHDEVERCIERCIEKDPKDRYPSMTAVSDALRGLVTKIDGISAQSNSPVQEISDVITIPPSTGIRTEPSRSPMSNPNQVSGNALTPISPLAAFSDKNTDPVGEIIPQPNDGEQDTLTPNAPFDRTMLDLAPDAAETFIPNSSQARKLSTEFKKQQDKGHLGPSSPRSLKAFGQKRPSQNQHPSEDPSIKLAPVGNTSSVSKQTPTEQTPTEQAPTEQSLPANQPEPPPPSNTLRKRKVSNNARLVPPSIDPKPPRGSEPGPEDVGISLHWVIVLIGGSILISFTLGWILRGL